MLHLKAEDERNFHSRPVRLDLLSGADWSVCLSTLSLSTDVKIKDDPMKTTMWVRFREGSHAQASICTV